MRHWIVICLAVALVVGASSVSAMERLVAEYFPQRHFSLPSQWAAPRFTGDIQADSRVVAGLSDVELRLAIPPRFTSPPQRVSIFLALPSQVPGLRGSGGLELSWSTRGRFNAGTVHPGERALLFEGVVDTSILSDFVNFTFTIDAREMLSVLRVEPVYEIEPR